MSEKHYQAELQYLRESVRSLERERSTDGLIGDPKIEQMLQGIAFLLSPLGRRVEDAVPEITSPLSELALPHLVRPIPATSILELAPIAGAVTGRQHIGRGARVQSVPIDGVPCPFRTTMDVDLVPLSIVETVAELGTPTPSLRTKFKIEGKGHEAIFQPEGIRTFIHDDFSTATGLYLWFARHLEEVVLTAGRDKSVRLGPSAVRPCGFDPIHSLLPWPPFVPDGYRLLQELFVLPEKLLFLDLVGLDRAVGMVGGDTFEIAFHFARPPGLASRPQHNCLRLHCTPVVNLFEVQSTPIKGSGRHLLSAEGLQPSRNEVYSVGEVLGSKQGQIEQRRYDQFFALAHRFGQTSYYKIERERSVLDDGIDTYLALQGPSAEEETVTAALTCTNRSLPTRLRIGDISDLVSGASPMTATFCNITRVTNPVRPPIGSELRWRLHGHLRQNERGVADAEGLRTMLGVYNYVAEANERAGHANRLRIDGIQNVAVAGAMRIEEGAPIRGARFSLDLDERSYASAGDAVLFGSVIAELLAGLTTANSFAELEVKLQPSGARYTWPARTGRRPIV